MRRAVLLAGVAVLMLGVSGLVWSAEAGRTRGTVTGTEAWRSEDGRLMLSIAIQDEAGAQRTFTVGPDNKEAFALVAGLKKGERVRIAFVAEGEGPQRVREIVREESQTERTKTGEGQAEARTERKQEVRREGEGREVPKTETRREGERQTEVKKEGEGERRVERGSLRGELVSMAESPDNAEILALTVRPGEGQNVTVYVRKANGELYGRVKGLAVGDKIVLGWVSENGQRWVQKVGKMELSRENTKREAESRRTEGGDQERRGE